jgi:hypothetical protein
MFVNSILHQLARVKYQLSFSMSETVSVVISNDCNEINDNTNEIMIPQVVHRYSMLKLTRTYLINLSA